ncbi:MAG: hypothetical protein FWD81_04875 [Methanomassiliicoccaceae archaeon]|nr:hypothetical protein [Methanomassiliicoccaceae archaeon]
MAREKGQAKAAKGEPQMRYQCLKCYKTFKDEQTALDCCGSLTQAWSTNYTRWGKQHWYGR